MPGDRFDEGSERWRHDESVGRAGLLAWLDHLRVDGGTARRVASAGRPGAGKSALLAAWSTRRVAAGAVVPHRSIRRDGLPDPRAPGSIGRRKRTVERST